MSASHTVLGIRHHGPGSAAAVCAALAQLKPDLILIEGPPEADALIPLIAEPDMVPPVAILVHAPDAPEHSVFYPFATFSPEWQALRYALANSVRVRFFDLPASHQLALSQAERARDSVPAEEADKGLASPTSASATTRIDAWALLAEAAGLADGEQVWDQLVESTHDELERFHAIAELMREMREAQAPDPECLRREAHMRTELRAALKEANQIVVVCGAWHAPALLKLGPAKDDAALLKGLPKLKVQTTFVPWNHARLALASGYGAGVRSPGWYAHLWQHGLADPALWLTRATQCLRNEGFDLGPAHTIEALRLAQGLAALRARPAPSLDELNAALQSVHGEGHPDRLRLIDRQLNVGEVLGRVPENTPMPPIVADFQREQKRLRLPAEAAEKLLSLDLRKDLDRERSIFLHRLALLSVPWARAEASDGRGTYRENWRMAWDPADLLPIIDAARDGNRIEDAAGRQCILQATAASRLPDLAALLESALKADLKSVLPVLNARLDAVAAARTDVLELIQAFVRLAPITRYGDVRGSDVSALGGTLNHYLERICVGLIPACSQISDEAAGDLLPAIGELELCLRQTDQGAWRDDWLTCLERLIDADVHLAIEGRALRILLDRDRIDAAEAARRLGLALSPSVAERGAAWLQGFLAGSGLLLVINAELRTLIDRWLCDLPTEIFAMILPMIRRSFADFQKAERRQIGEALKQGTRGTDGSPTDLVFDAERSRRLLPTFRALWGLP